MFPDVDAVRGEFPALARWTHFALAHKAPLPRCAEEAFAAFAKDFRDTAGDRNFSQERIDEARVSLAALVGAAPETLAFVKNTSEGINIVASGLRLEAGDEVIVSRLEHEANLLPWRRLAERGIVVAAVSGGTDDLAERIGPRTRVVATSWVTYRDGYRFDLASLGRVCRSQDALLVVDGIQGVGVLSTPLRELGADVLACGGHKGLLGVAGAGFLYCREDVIERIDPRYVSKFTFSESDKWSSRLSPKQDARRFEYGNPNFLGIAILKRSSEFLADLGLVAIEARIRLLTTRMMDRLGSAGVDVTTPLDWDKRAGIVSVEAENAERTAKRLRERNILVSVKDGRFVRMACHFFNTEDEVERVASELSACL